MLEKPILALTLSIAGKRDVGEAVRPGLDAALSLIFGQVEASLAACRAHAEAGGVLASRFSEAAARLTLVTGLADGADQIAADLFLGKDGQAPGVSRVLGAILPCDAPTYVRNSPVSDHGAFERQLQACAFVMELDGSLPEPPTAKAAGVEARLDVVRARGGAFSAQSEFLMRHSDLLIAVDEEAAGGQVGGTRQTIRNALEFGLPVVLVRLGQAGVMIVRTRSDLEHPCVLVGDEARAALDSLVRELVGLTGTGFDAHYVRTLLDEFYGPASPGRSRARRQGVLPAVWRAFESRFEAPRAALSAQPAASAYAAYRQRASELSSYYAGLYRGSFLVGYALAVVAVTLAVASLLTLLALALDTLPEAWGLPILIGLGGLKLLSVGGMTLLAKQAHEQHLSHRAADYRYLAERLRAMTFLPQAGSLRPPSHLSQPFATRVATQGIIDRLFDSIVRQAEPLATLPCSEGRTVRPDAGAARRIVDHDWIAAQADYHNNNAILLQRITQWLEAGARRLNGLIVGIVLADLALLGLHLFHVLPESLAKVLETGVEPALIALAAILPAAVASMNGVRFQSEFSRLADRSEQMKFELLHLQKRARTLWARSDRALDVLYVAEDAARLTLDEVAEWTALYGKEFLEM